MLLDKQLWVVAGANEGRAAELLALSPATLQVVHRLDVPSTGLGFAGAGGRIWIEGSTALLEIDPGTGTLAATVPLPTAGVDDLASDAAGTTLVAAASGDRIYKLAPSTGISIGTYRGPEGGAADVIGVANGQAFVETGTGMNSGFVRLDLTTGRFHSVDGGGNNPRLVISGQRLLESSPQNFSKTSNYCERLSSGNPIASLPSVAASNSAYPVAYAAGTFYYLSYMNSQTYTLHRIAFSGCAYRLRGEHHSTGRSHP